MNDVHVFSLRGVEIQASTQASSSGCTLRFVMIYNFRYDLLRFYSFVTISLRFPIRFIRPSLSPVFSSLLYIEDEIWSDEADRNRNLGSLRFVAICYDFQFRYEFVTAPIRSIQPSLSLNIQQCVLASCCLTMHIPYRNGTNTRAKLGWMKQIEDSNEIVTKL